MSRVATDAISARDPVHRLSLLRARIIDYEIPTKSRPTASEGRGQRRLSTQRGATGPSSWAKFHLSRAARDPRVTPNVNRLNESLAWDLANVLDALQCLKSPVDLFIFMLQ